MGCNFVSLPFIDASEATLLIQYILLSFIYASIVHTLYGGNNDVNNRAQWHIMIIQTMKLVYPVGGLASQLVYYSLTVVHIHLKHRQLGSATINILADISTPKMLWHPKILWHFTRSDRPSWIMLLGQRKRLRSHWDCYHCSDFIWTSWRFKSQTTPPFVQIFLHCASKNIKAPRDWPLLGECSQRSSKAEYVSIS